MAVHTQSLRVGTRGSALARAQADAVAGALRRLEITPEIVVYETHGDKVLDRALSELGREGVFVTELEHALVHGEIDCAVHSLKDLPSRLAEGLAVVAYGDREDPRDVVLGDFAMHDLKDLPQGARLGTSSVRRVAFLKGLRPDLELVPVRGNLATRVKKWHEAGWEGLVLAAAGVHRLGWQEQIAGYLDPLTVVPAPGQGIVAVEARADDEAVVAALAVFNDEASALCAAVERRILAELAGGCQVPLGAYARLEGERIEVIAQVADPAGTRLVRQTAMGSRQDAVALAMAAVDGLRHQGVEDILAAARGASQNG